MIGLIFSANPVGAVFGSSILGKIMNEVNQKYYISVENAYKMLHFLAHFKIFVSRQKSQQNFKQESKGDSKQESKQEPK